MPTAIQLVLADPQRQTLEAARDHHPKAYMRERAAALLKIADGMSALQVARQGLLKPRDPDTVYRWVRRWQTVGLAGLQVQAGRGRKAAFSPSARRPPQRAGGAARSSPPCARLLRVHAEPLEPGPPLGAASQPLAGHQR